MARIHRTLYKKDLHDPDNHDCVITHLEPDILECEAKWALGSITMNKASRGDGIPVELFQTLKDDAVKVLHSIYQQIGKTQQWPQEWKGQFSFQFQRKTMPKNVQTTIQLHSSHTLGKQCSKFSKPGFNRTWTTNFQTLKLDLEKAEKPDIKLPTYVQFCSVTQSCPTLCNPVDCSTLGLPVHHQLPEFTQTHAYCVSNAIQPSHPLLSPSSPTFNLSQKHGLFQWGSSSHQVAKVLEFQLQNQSF